jgi:hypothetical protein
MNRFHIGILSVGLLAFQMPVAFSNPQTTAFVSQSEELSKLRTEVALLQETLRDERADVQARSRGLELQRSDLSLRLRREEAMIQELTENISELRSSQEPVQSESDIDALLLRTADVLKEDILQSIPYRHDERIKSIDDIILAREKQEISAMQAATRLWSVADDEYRLNKENQLDKMTITINDEDVLVDVIRFGMMGMMFQTEAGTFGVWNPKKGWVELENPSRSFASMFTQFQKGIRSGVFSIPLSMEQK